MKSFREFFFESAVHPKVQKYLDKIKVVKGVKTIEGNVDVSEYNLTTLPFEGVHVTGDFDCGYNQLTSLQGAPSSVGENFNCSGNHLTSLQGAPSSVGGHFYCNSNQLTSLQGAPSSVGGYFSCSSNQLTSLQGAPSSVDGSFFCEHNPVKTLDGFYTQAKTYLFDNFTDAQVKAIVPNNIYNREVKQHTTSSGDTDIDQMFDNILEDL